MNASSLKLKILSRNQKLKALKPSWTARQLSSSGNPAKLASYMGLLVHAILLKP